MKSMIKAFLPNPCLRWIRNYQKKKIYTEYQGNQVHCPICKSNFSKFATFGLKPRDNARCHQCGSLERHRLIWMFISKKCDLFNSTSKIKLLHFAPEYVFYSILSSKKNIEYYPCDLQPENFPYKGRVDVIKADITNIPFEDNYFDVIICNHVLEHIPDDSLAMSELYRVLKMGGWSILQVPIDTSLEHTYEDFSITSPKEREKAFGKDDHVRWYGRDYKKKLEDAQFKVSEIDLSISYTQEELFKYGLMKSELLHYCEK